MATPFKLTGLSLPALSSAEAVKGIYLQLTVSVDEVETLQRRYSLACKAFTGKINVDSVSTLVLWIHFYELLQKVEDFVRCLL